MSKAHLTAISRRKISVPAQLLAHLAAGKDRVLDYGCGRGNDADTFGWNKYDPHYFPTMPWGDFDVIFCNYVLNVIPVQLERDAVITSIRGLLKVDGTAYITVRRDVSALRGWTTKGTWQGLIELDLPVYDETSDYCIYVLQK